VREVNPRYKLRITLIIPVPTSVVAPPRAEVLEMDNESEVVALGTFSTPFELNNLTQGRFEVLRPITLPGIEWLKGAFHETALTSTVYCENNVPRRKGLAIEQSSLSFLN